MRQVFRIHDQAGCSFREQESQWPGTIGLDRACAITISIVASFIPFRLSGRHVIVSPCEPISTEFRIHPPKTRRNFPEVCSLSRRVGQFLCFLVHQLSGACDHDGRRTLFPSLFLSSFLFTSLSFSLVPSLDGKSVLSKPVSSCQRLVSRVRPYLGRDMCSNFSATSRNLGPPRWSLSIYPLRRPISGEEKKKGNPGPIRRRDGSGSPRPK